MTNVIVVSFKDEAKAIDALHKLVELDSFGDISMYEKVIVRKNANGECEILKQDSFEGWRTLTGMGVGSLLGILGGPVGFVIGLYTGTTIGMLGDLGHYDFADDFVSKTKDKLAAGTVSIIAEIDEDSSAFVDTSLKPFGAVIIRSDVDFEFDNYVNEQIENIENDIAEERASLKKAIGNDKAKIQKKIAELKAKRKATIAEFVAGAKASEKSMKDKTTAGIAKVKADVADFVDTISSEVNEERAGRIRTRIARYEAKLADLNKQLKALTADLVEHN
jgi:uncharacterized membrane protein